MRTYLRKPYAAGLLIVLWAIDANANAIWVIPRGHEQSILELAQTAVSEASEATLLGVSINDGWITIHTSLDGRQPRDIVLGRPGESAMPLGGPWTSLGGNVWLNCDDSCLEGEVEAWRAVAAGLAREALPRKSTLWVQAFEAERGHHLEGSKAAFNARRWVTVGIFSFASLWLLWAAARVFRKQRFERDALGLFAVLLAFVTVAILVPDHLSVHDHNSFVLRSDCAFSPDCDVDPRAPGWSTPTFHVYHLLLSPLPNRSGSTSMASLALTVFAALLSYVFVRMLFTHFERPRAGRVAAFWAVVFFLAQPVVLRLAVADTFWPLFLVALWASGVALLYALRTGSFAAMLAASGWFAIAALSSVVYLTIIPVAVVAILAWRLKPSGAPRWAAPIAIASGLLFIAPYFFDAFQSMFLKDDSGSGFLLAVFVKMLHVLVEGLLWLRPSLTPFVGMLLLVLALLAFLTNYRRMLLPIVFLFLLTEPMLSSLSSMELVDGFPGRLVLALPGLHILAVLGGGGFAWLDERVRFRSSFLQGALAGLLVVSLLFCSLGWMFVTESTALGRELTEISRAFDDLEQHDLLVLSPTILPRLAGTQGGGDPVEVHFPQGEYRYVFKQRGLDSAPAVTLDIFLEQVARGEFQQHQRVLFHMSTGLRTFLRAEIDSGVVPDSLERPELVALREQYVLEPARVYDIDTRQYSGISARLLADRQDSSELGFYWLHKRSDEKAPQHAAP